MGRHLLVLAMVAIAAALIGAGPANADFAVTSFGGSATNADGTRNAQAGAHADFTTRIDFATVERDGIRVPDGDVKDIDVALPPGLVGNPVGVPTCTMEQLSNNTTSWISAALCPVDSQVGVADFELTIGGSFPYQVGVYNIEAPKGAPALFGFNVQGTVILVRPELRGGDYGLTVHVANTSQSIAILSTRVTLWGVPADPVHDSQRYFEYASGFPSGLPRKAFMTAPMNCAAGPLTTSLRARSWQQQDVWSTASFDTDFNGEPLAVEGCETVPFDPSLDTAVDTTAPDSAVGLRVQLNFPQEGLLEPDGIATGHLKKAVVTLPGGMTINPASAGGLTACSEAQLSFGSNEPIQCALSSRIGTADAITPLLSEQLTGGIYLRTQNSLDPESGELFRIALVLGNEERGVLVKLPGSIVANKSDGQLTATFDNNPQLPISTVNLQFKGGSRAPLATPTTCGPKTIEAVLSSWSGKTVERQSSYNVDCAPGLGGFRPSFTAGTVSPVGGAFSPLALSIAKPAGNSDLAGLRMELPQGLVARLAGNVGTQVGTVNALAGPGATPYVLPGQVYLEGAYGDAPFSLRVVVPAVAGPFNLGTVVVRQRIQVDRNDAHVTVVSDPVPTIVSGVPVRLQRLDVNIDKPGFIINPTSCEPKTIAATLSAISGQTAAMSSRFQVGDCSSLGYTPKMAIKVGARGKLTRGKRTPLDVTLSMTRAQANNRSVRVTLPKTINARLDVVNRRVACTIEQFRADRCPMVVGTGTAMTPLLGDPLRGPAYFVYNPARRLPDLVIRLKGQVAFDLVGKVTITRDLRLQTAFDTVPDVPITKFRLQLESGSRNGPVGLTRSVCSASVRRTLAASLAFTAQSNKRVARSQKISVAGCGRMSRRAARRRAQ